jgi:hypothetical protein
MKTTLKTLALAALLLPGIASAESNKDDTPVSPTEMKELEDKAPTIEVVAGEMSKEEIAKASQNPLTAMYSLPIQNNTYVNIGPDKKTKNIANFQPVLPFDLNDDWTVVTRTIIPLTSQPNIGHTPYDRTFGVGDTTFTAFFTPKASTESGWIWGVGPTLYLPTASDNSLGTNNWGAGASAVALKIDGKFVYGALLSNVWSYAGENHNAGKRINSMTIQPFINYNMNDGWFLTTVPIITANWEVENDYRWTVPVGAGVGRAMKLGKTPMTAQLHGYYNVVTPDNYGEEWQMRIQVQLLFPR